MDDESSLLGDPDTPEMIQSRVMSIMEQMMSGKVMGSLTEKDVQNVEEALKKIQDGILHAKRTMLTEEDILNVANLNFFSPAPMNTVSVTDHFDFSSPLQDPNDLELDYEESIDNRSVSSFGSPRLEIDTDDEKVRIEVQKKNRYFPKKQEVKTLPEAEIKPITSLESIDKKPIVVNNKRSSKSPKIEDLIYLSSDSEAEKVPKKRAKIVFDLKTEKEEEGSDTEDEDGRNVSLANFSRKLTKENTYVKLRASKMHVDTNKLGLTYPLGVTFDSISDTWFITNIPYQYDGNGNNGESKVLKIYVGKDKTKSKYTDIEGPLIDQPSAITVYKEGSQIAVLCSNHQKKPSICIINHHRHDNVSTFCTWRSKDLDFTHPCRGLARTKGGNLITTDRPSHGPPRIRIFSKGTSSRVKEITYLLRNANMPSFIASSDDTVVVTDLGSTQTVIHLKIDDSNWKNVKFETLRVITTTGVNFRAEEMLNNQYFIYVSGVQIDKNGHIMVADAKNHHFKLFNPSMKFMNRISTDFPVPYVSSFHVNKHGECLILSTRETNKIHFAKLTSSNRLEKHIKSGAGKRIGVKNPLSSKRKIFSIDSD